MDHEALSVRLFGINFSTGTPAEILRVAEALPADKPRQIVTANIDHVITLSKDPQFREVYADAAARTLDGTPLVWLSRLRHKVRVRRITGHDLIDAVASGDRAADRRFFLVCATAATGQAMTRLLIGAGIEAERIAFEVPPYGFEADAAFGGALAARIRAHGTTLLIMGVGAPKSELWVHRQGSRLGGPIVLNVGEALNVAAGLVPRAPEAMQRLGLEWLFRFATQPRRLFRRYFIRSWGFLALALRDTHLVPEAHHGPGPHNLAR